MAEISAIIVTVVVPFSRCSSGAIERREAQFDRRDERLIGVINNSSRRYGRCTT